MNIEKIELVNNLLNKVFFYDNNLYKVDKVNTRNIYAYKYYINDKLKLDTSILFYSIGNNVIYVNFLNKIEKTKTVLKLKDLLTCNYIILNEEQNNNIENIYFVSNTKNNIKLKENYENSLFYNDKSLLKQEFFIKYFIHSMNTPHFEANRNKEYYNNIYNEEMQKLKKYIYDNNLLDKIESICNNTSEEDIIDKYNTNFYDEFKKFNIDNV